MVQKNGQIRIIIKCVLTNHTPVQPAAGMSSSVGKCCSALGGCVRCCCKVGTARQRLITAFLLLSVRAGLVHQPRLSCRCCGQAVGTARGQGRRPRRAPLTWPDPGLPLAGRLARLLRLRRHQRDRHPGAPRPRAASSRPWPPARDGVRLLTLRPLPAGRAEEPDGQRCHDAKLQREQHDAAVDNAAVRRLRRRHLPRPPPLHHLHGAHADAAHARARRACAQSELPAVARHRTAVPSSVARLKNADRPPPSSGSSPAACSPAARLAPCTRVWLWRRSTRACACCRWRGR